MTDSSSPRPLALITGASSGIGAAFAARLAQDGYDLVLVARRRDRLAALAAQLRDQHQVQVDVLAADLSHADGVRAAEQRIREANHLDLLVNNAGFGGYMPFVNLDPDRAEESVYLQVIAVTRLSRAALPSMIARGQGAIINLSSRLAFSGAFSTPTMPKRATYAASKAYIVTFTRLLSSELDGTGVKVQALCPGIVSSDFHEQAGQNVANYPAHVVMTPEALVDASLAGLQLGEVICVPGLDDPALLREIDDAQRRLWDHSTSGTPAERYTQA